MHFEARGARGDAERGAGWAAALLLAGLYLALVASPLPPAAPKLVSADAHAFLGLAWLLEHGQVSGRDFAAAYGAVPQALAWWAAALRGEAGSAGAFPMVAFLLRATGVALLVAWAAGVGRGAAGTVAVAAAALAAGAASDYTVFRAGCALVALFAAARALEPSARLPLARLALAAAALAALFLVSFDYFAYALLATCAGGALLALPGPWRARPEAPRAPRARLAALVAGVLVAGALLDLVLRLTAAGGAAHAADPFARAFELAATYPQTFGLPWQGGAAETALWLALAVAAPAAALGAATRVAAPLRTDLVLLAPFALLALKGAVTRADRGHVALGLLPALLLLTLVAAAGSRSRGGRLAAGALALAALAFWPRAPFGPLRPAPESWHPAAAWRALRTRAIAPALVPAETLRAAAARPGPLFVFPLQTGLAAQAGRPLAAPVDQAYAAHTPAMQGAVVARLEREGPDLDVLYGLDGERTWAVDRVQSIARSPVLFEYLWRRFERAPARLLDGGFLLLRRRAVALEPTWRELAFRARADAGALRLALDEPRPCPLLSLGIALGYPAWRALGWPAGVIVRGWDGDRVVLRSRLVPLATGAPFVTYLSPLAGEDFARLFDAELPRAAPALSRLEIAGEDGGWFGVAVNSIRVESLRCLG